MYLLIDTPSGQIVGFVNSDSYPVAENQILLPEPQSFDRAASADWLLSGGVLLCDPQAVLERAMALRITTIKQEAAELIAATDWRLQRAKEREEAGWAALAAVDEILVQRESIRRSSDAAEDAVQALPTVAQVSAFTWDLAVTVPPPCRVTHAAFLDALEAQGEDVIPSILVAKESNGALLKWWTYFDKAQVISATDPRLEAGLQGLEIAGLLPEGGATAVLNALNPA